MRPPALRVHCDGLIVDNFAGGGASVGIEWALGRSPALARALAAYREDEARLRRARMYPTTAREDRP